MDLPLLCRQLLNDHKFISRLIRDSTYQYYCWSDPGHLTTMYVLGHAGGVRNGLRHATSDMSI